MRFVRSRRSSSLVVVAVGLVAVVTREPSIARAAGVAVDDEEMHDVQVVEIAGGEAEEEDPAAWGPRVQKPRGKNAKASVEKKKKKTTTKEGDAANAMSDDEMKTLWKSSLEKAIKRGDAAFVEKQLDAGFDVEATPVHDVRRLGYTPLVTAIAARQPKVARLFLERGADPDVRTIWLTSPLSIAVFVKPEDVKKTEQAIECVDLLLEFGADIDGRTDDGWTPLLHAARHRNLQLVQHLLEKGADPTLKETYNTDDPYKETGVFRDYLDHAIERSSESWSDCAPGKPAAQRANCVKMLEWAEVEIVKRDAAAAAAAAEAEAGEDAPVGEQQETPGSSTEEASTTSDDPAPETAAKVTDEL